VDYITKPFQEQQVLARVKTHLQLQQLTKNLEQRVAEKTADLEAALTQLQQSQLHLAHREKCRLWAIASPQSQRMSPVHSSHHRLWFCHR